MNLGELLAEAAREIYSISNHRGPMSFAHLYMKIGRPLDPYYIQEGVEALRGSHLFKEVTKVPGACMSSEWEYIEPVGDTVWDHLEG